MLSINALIISIVVSSLMPKFDKNPHLIIPSIILLTVCVVAVILATISTIPKVTKGVSTKEQIANKTSNLLFFGNFHNMTLKEFEFGIAEMKKDSDFLYSSLTRDLYYLGLVLSKKYKFLNICYKVFMFGLTISVISFVIAMTNAPKGI